MKLAIISHTEHYKTTDGTIVGWGPTVMEINHLLELFEEIYHVAMLHHGQAPPSALPYNADRVIFVPIPAIGGRTLAHKLHTIIKAPEILRAVSKTLKKVDCFQLRTPTGIGVFLIPYLTVFVKTKGWYKYAGNWNQKHPPLGYRLQRWMLKHQSRKVTVNGTWAGQPKHCLSFENPCLTLEDLENGKEVIRTKSYSGKISFCFVGRLEREKGVARIIEAFGLLTAEDKAKIEQIHFVGNGIELSHFKKLGEKSGVAMHFHGFLSRKDVFEVYARSHVFLLPTTASEGFPKVIAEAMNFGCIPLVSGISAIGHYVIHKKNGFLLDTITVANLKEQVEWILTLDPKDYQKMLNSGKAMIPKFTFANYHKKIRKEILQDLNLGLNV